MPEPNVAAQLVGLVVGCLEAFVILSLLLQAAAALCNIDLKFLKACLVVLVSLVVLSPLVVGGFFLLAMLGFSVMQPGGGLAVIFVVIALSVLALVMVIVATPLYWLLVPTRGPLQALKAVVLHGLITLLVFVMLACVNLVVLACFQIEPVLGWVVGTTVGVALLIVLAVLTIQQIVAGFRPAT